MSKNVKDKLLKELVDNQINYEIEGEGEKEVIILDKDSVDKSFAIPQLKALILDCLENSREYGVKLMLLAGTENETPVDQLEMMFELKEGKIDSSKSLKNLSKDRSLKYLSSDSEELNRADRYEELLKKFDIDYERVNNTFLLNEKIVDEVARLEGVEIIPNSEESSIYITKETIVNDQKKFNEIEKRTKEKYNMGKDNEVLFENIESYYLSGHESYLKEVIDIATRNDLFVEISSTGTSLNINHEGSTLLNLVLDGELSQEIKNKIDEATSLLVKENSRILSELTGGSVGSYESTIEEYEEALKQADSLYEESQDYVNDYALPQKSDEKEREVKSIDFFTDENSESARVNEKSMKLEDDLNLRGKDPLRYIMEHSQNKKEAMAEIDKYCDDQKKLILEGQLTKQLVEDGIDYEIKDGIVILKDLDKIPNNPKLAYDVIEGLEAGRVLILDEDADYRDGSKILDRIKEVAKKFNEEVDELLKIHSTGDNFKKSNFNSKEIGENAYQMELTSKGFKVVNDTPFEYMRKILSNRKVTFYTKKDDRYFIETEEGLIERNEQSLHEDIANCKFDVLIFKDGFRETKGKEDSVSLGDSRFIELLKAINEPKNLNTILNLGEQLEFTIARFDGVVDFSSYSEVILSFCIGDRGFECNTTINKNNPRVQSIIDMIEENPNWDEIFRLCNANHFNVAQVHDDVIIQDKEGNTILKFKDSKIKETPKQLAEPSDVKAYIDSLIKSDLKDYSKEHILDLTAKKFKNIPVENLLEMINEMFDSKFIPITTVSIRDKSDVKYAIDILLSTIEKPIPVELRRVIDGKIDEYFDLAEIFLSDVRFVTLPIYDIHEVCKNLKQLLDLSRDKYSTGLNSGRLLILDYRDVPHEDLDNITFNSICYSAEFLLNSLVNESRDKQRAHRVSIDNGYHNLPKSTYMLTSRDDLARAINNIAQIEVDEDLINSVYCHLEPVLDKLGIVKVDCVDVSRLDSSKIDLVWDIWRDTHKGYPHNEIIPMINGDNNLAKAIGINIFINNLFGAIRDLKLNKSFDHEDISVFIDNANLNNKDFVCNSIISLLLEARENVIKTGHLSLANNIVGVEIAKLERLRLDNTEEFELRVNSDNKLEIVYGKDIHQLTSLVIAYKKTDKGIEVYAGMFDSYERKALNNLTLQDLSFTDFTFIPNYVPYLIHSKNEELKNKIRLYYRVYDFIHNHSKDGYQKVRNLIEKTFTDFDIDELNELKYDNIVNNEPVENIELVRKLINVKTEGTTDSEVEQAIETAIKEVSENFNVTLGRFIEFQYETGRNVAKKKVKELQNKIKVEEDIEKKEELTQKLNGEYSVLEQAEVSIEEVDNAEACNISYFIETKVYRIIGKYKYLKYKDYIEYRARQGAESIVLDKKNVVDDMTKYLTISNRVMRPVRTVTFVYNKEAMKNFSKEEKLYLLNRILSKPTIPYFASEILPKNKVIERICIGTRTGKVQSLPFDIYLYCEGKDLMLNYLDENLNLSGINYEAFETILKEDLTVACLDERAYDKVRGYCDRKKLDSSRVFNLSEYMTKVYKGFRIDGKFAVIVNDKEREFYNLNKLPGVTTKIQ